MKTLKILNWIFFGPIIIVHELLHLIPGVILNVYTGVEVSTVRNMPEVLLYSGMTSAKWKIFISSFAPIIQPIAVIILAFSFNFFVYVLIYFIIAQILYTVQLKTVPGLFLSEIDINVGLNK